VFGWISVGEELRSAVNAIARLCVQARSRQSH